MGRPKAGYAAPERVVDLVQYQTVEAHRKRDAEAKQNERALMTHIGKARRHLPRTYAPWVEAHIDRDQVTERVVARVAVTYPEAQTASKVLAHRLSTLQAMVPQLRAVPGAERLLERVTQRLAKAEASTAPADDFAAAERFVPALLLLAVRDVIERHAILLDMIDQAVDEHDQLNHATEIDALARSAIAKAIEQGRQSHLQSMVSRLRDGSVKIQPLPQAAPTQAPAAAGDAAAGASDSPPAQGTEGGAHPLPFRRPN
jgi:hypothetical protein